MKLDRNINKDGTGKYALVNIRRLNISSNGDHHNAFKELLEAGIISLGNESPGDQFFVMKYKDRFTAPALRAYADAVAKEIEKRPGIAESLAEYFLEMDHEAREAANQGVRIPD
jgi:hypothetical protein